MCTQLRGLDRPGLVSLSSLRITSLRWLGVWLALFGMALSPSSEVLLAQEIALLQSSASSVIAPTAAGESSTSSQPASDDEVGDRWPAFRRSLSQTGVATGNLPDQLELLWELQLGEQIVATAAIDRGQVLIPCLSGELWCVAARTGDVIWKFRSQEDVPENSIRPGFKAAPTVHEDTVYIGDEEGGFHAIDRMTGKARWRFASSGEIYSGAAIVGDRLLFGSYDNKLYCLSRMTGELLWQFETKGYVHCTPGVSGEFTFISGCDEHLRQIEIATGKQVADLPLQTYLIASPAIVGERIYVGTYASEVLAVNFRTQAIEWRYKAADQDFPFHSSAAVTETHIVVGGRDKAVHAIDRMTGKGLWRFPTRARVDSSPAIIGQRVFIGSNDGNLYELDLLTGAERWRFQSGKAISAGPAIAEGILAVGNESRDGRFLCFGAR